jgi:hypothetical protein
VVQVQPPSPSSIHAKLDDLQRPSSSRQTLTSQITPFCLVPHTSIEALNAQKASFFGRMISIIKSSAPVEDYSFDLFPMPHTSISPSSSTQNVLDCTSMASWTPFLTFHDQTPVTTMGSIKGMLEFNQEKERAYGVETSFWIAIALCYLDFLSEREVSIMIHYASLCALLRSHSELLSRCIGLILFYHILENLVDLQ